MPTALSDQTIAVIKATIPALEEHGLTITRRMYERMFQDEAIRDLFNQSHHGETGSQPKALAVAVLAYARHIDNLGALGGMVERIAQKHVALDIRPEHYPAVGKSLLGAIADVLGEAATDSIMAAWGEAYWALAEILIGREAAVYRDLAAQPGGWNGWREFVIEKVADESSIIRSFVLVPADGGAVVAHKPGQYLGFALDLPGVGKLRRNYSISCAPNNKAYRITVKREAAPGVPPGAASNWLHDHATPGTVLRVAPPAGDFFLDTESNGPVALVSGGVGLTPMVSMLETIAATQKDRPVLWVHGSLNGRVHAMRGHVRDLGHSLTDFRSAVVYADPRPQDRAGVDYDTHGLITAPWLVQAARPGTTFYLCGPRPFLRSLVSELHRQGVPASQVRYEFFGPADELLDDEGDRLAAD
ncbi:MAG: NO-inducible flavohemoprotein [Proteobacteria bacterium]|nr:NO-inducible flavohemoprotein [Pseudomonadota bacterium]